MSTKVNNAVIFETVVSKDAAVCFLKKKKGKKNKARMKKEGNQLTTNCRQLKMIAEDGKRRETDMADTEQLLCIIQSIPSPKAEPFKMWLAQVGRERIEETIRIAGFLTLKSTI